MSNTFFANPQHTPKAWRLSTRLLRGVTGIVAGCLLIVSLMVIGFTKFEIAERLDDSLQEVAERLQFAVLLLNQPGNVQAVAHLSHITPLSLAYQITDTQGHVLLRSANAPVEAFVTPIQAGFYGQKAFRVYVMPAAQPDRFILVGEPQFHRAQATHHAIFIAVLPILGAIPCIWVLVMWQVRRSMAPLVRLQDEIKERGSGNLNPVPNLNLPTELATIQTAVNLLLERVHKALAAERAFAANAAHELRNPIAALLAQAQTLHSTITTYPATNQTSAIAQRLTTMTEQIQRLGRITEKLLQLSRAVAGTGLQRNRFDMLSVLHVVADELDPPHNTTPQRLVLETGAFTSLTVMGDMDATGILLRNLLENALCHSPTGSAVHVNLYAETPQNQTCTMQQHTTLQHTAKTTPPFIPTPKTVLLTIENQSTALSPTTLTALTDPFVRGCTQAEGSGLGLAIARTISNHMGVPMQLFSPIPGHKTGFMVRLSFPVVTEKT
ncbi:MAG: HAMP domain-containing sensor histidine kinase [Acetobacter orientalis]